MKCLVTGATGFIGRQLCRRLVQEGHTLVPVSRAGGSLPDGGATHTCDFAERDLDDALLAGVDTVVHLAGIAHQDAAPALYRAVNFQATVRLYRAARAAGVNTFIFVSSVKAMGPAMSAQARPETDCIAPQDPYGRSKREAELALEEIYDGNSSLLIVRPALVYGEEFTGNIRLLDSGIRLGLPRPPALGQRSMIARDDLVELLGVLASDPPAGCHTWIASSPRAYSTRDIYDQLRAARGLGRGLAWLPAWGWRMGARILDLVAREPGGTMFAKMFGSEVYDASAVTRATGWRPRLRLSDLLSAGSSDGGGS